MKMNYFKLCFKFYMLDRTSLQKPYPQMKM